MGWILYIILVLIVTSSAHGQGVSAQNVQTLDEKPTDIFYQIGGEARLRNDKIAEGSMGRFAPSGDDSDWESRIGFWLKLNKGEYFQSYIKLTHINLWGRNSEDPGDENAGSKTSFSGDNGIFVNEAWGLWKFSDTITARFGRQVLDYGYGALFSKNNWEDITYAFDAFDFIFDWEFLKLSLVGIKSEELVFDKEDPEENYYVVNIDLKTLPDFIRSFNFSFVQQVRDQGYRNTGATTPTLLPKLNIQRYTLEVLGQGNNLGTEVATSYVAGTDSGGVSGADRKIQQVMFDLELSYQITEWSYLKFWTGFHHDSGDSDISGGTSDKDVKTYDPIFYNRHENAGYMDLLAWGNLTYIRFGTSLLATPRLLVGAEYLVFTKSESADNINFGRNGNVLSDLVAADSIRFPTNVKDIGTELDIWLDYNFHSGLKGTLIMSMFKPGAAISDTQNFNGTTPTGLAGMNTPMYAFKTQVEVSF